MNKTYSKNDISIVNLYIGCKLRLERLKKNLSQHHLGINSGTDATAVGRIERAEHESSWSRIFLISQYLEVDFHQLFHKHSEKELLEIVSQCYSLETKLTAEKEQYYVDLRNSIKARF